MRSVPTDLGKNYSKMLVNKEIPPKNHYYFHSGKRLHSHRDRMGPLAWAAEECLYV